MRSGCVYRCVWGGFDRVRGLERGEKNVCSDLGNGVT